MRDCSSFMSSFNHLTEELLEHFEAKDGAREATLRLSRIVVRSCSGSIRSAHRGDFDLAKERLEEAGKYLAQIRERLKDHPDVRYAGFVDDAEQEYAEATVVLSLITRRKIPTPGEVGVEPANYLTGLGDVTGELRRHILDLVREGSPTEGEPFLAAMEDIYYLLCTFDYPEAITRGLRRKKDLARSMLERTRGDLTNASGQRELEHRLKELEDKLKGSDPIV